jgi:hypothetical protein
MLLNSYLCGAKLLVYLSIIMNLYISHTGCTCVDFCAPILSFLKIIIIKINKFGVASSFQSYLVKVGNARFFLCLFRGKELEIYVWGQNF